MYILEKWTSSRLIARRAVHYIRIFSVFAGRVRHRIKIASRLFPICTYKKTNKNKKNAVADIRFSFYYFYVWFNVGFVVVIQLMLECNKDRKKQFKMYRAKKIVSITMCIYN